VVDVDEKYKKLESAFYLHLPKGYIGFLQKELPIYPLFFPMYLSLFTPNEILFSGKVEFVEIPTFSGTIGILPNHAPLTTLVSQGKVKFIAAEKEDRILDSASFLFEGDYTTLAVDEGMVYLDGEEVQIFVRAGIDETAPETMNTAFEKAHLEIKKLTKSLQTRRIKNL
jgi:F0F1-type ATP synthase epsilon subunit